MTVRERAARFAEKAATTKPEDMAALFEAAIREELKDVASMLEASAANKEIMYRDLGLHGEDQARPFRDTSMVIQRRSEL